MEKKFTNMVLLLFLHHHLNIINQNKLLIMDGIVIGILMIKIQENGGKLISKRRE